MALQSRTAEISDFSDICALRRSFYQFFSSVFAKEANPEVLTNLDQILNLIEQVPELKDLTDNPDRPSGVNGLLLFRQSSNDQSTLLDILARDYARLFLGVGGKNTVFLCESSHCGNSNSLFQAPYFKMKELFSAIGLQKDPCFSEPEDHLALELASMAKLCDNNLSASPLSTTFSELLSTQKKFIEDHLKRWVPEFTLKLNSVAPESFYTACAQLLSGFLRIDSELVDRFKQIESV